MAARVQNVFDQGLISPQHSHYRHFSAHLQTTLETGRADWFTEDTNHRPIVDTIAELAPWHCFSAAYLAERSQRELANWSFPPADQDGPAPVVLPPKVGRNDPCPCGSGKKYKKCCLH